MLSFRVEPEVAERVREMSVYLGISQSEMIREALRRHLNVLAAQRDALVYEKSPLTAEELAFISEERWAPASDCAVF
ncbi:ribbon-helix-helix domain-containing protein [Candidatus Poriferisocius sp.]|uniref:ribbon-helix-helix domain-containing protein n=1 Tax=Candidatus Poriferisocius sp. TaxID=3101276 RepID=UPI003B5BA443